jgi:hypothetical protein
MWMAIFDTADVSHGRRYGAGTFISKRHGSRLVVQRAI